MRLDSSNLKRFAQHAVAACTLPAFLLTQFAWPLPVFALRQTGLEEQEDNQGNPVGLKAQLIDALTAPATPSAVNPATIIVAPAFPSSVDDRQTVATSGLEEWMVQFDEEVLNRLAREDPRLARILREEVPAGLFAIGAKGEILRGESSLHAREELLNQLWPYALESPGKESFAWLYEHRDEVLHSEIMRWLTVYLLLPRQAALDRVRTDRGITFRLISSSGYELFKAPGVAIPVPVVYTVKPGSLSDYQGWAPEGIAVVRVPSSLDSLKYVRHEELGHAIDYVMFPELYHRQPRSLTEVLDQFKLNAHSWLREFFGLLEPVLGDASFAVETVFEVRAYLRRLASQRAGVSYRELMEGRLLSIGNLSELVPAVAQKKMRPRELAVLWVNFALKDREVSEQSKIRQIQSAAKTIWSTEFDPSDPIQIRARRSFPRTAAEADARLAELARSPILGATPTSDPAAGLEGTFPDDPLEAVQGRFKATVIPPGSPDPFEAPWAADQPLDERRERFVIDPLRIFYQADSTGAVAVNLVQSAIQSKKIPGLRSEDVEILKLPEGEDPDPYTIVVKAADETLPKEELWRQNHVAIITFTPQMTLAQLIQEALAQWTGRSIGEILQIDHRRGRLGIYA